MRITLEFSGGLDAIFEGERMRKVELRDANQKENENWTIRRLLDWILANLLKGTDRTEMLIQRGTVRPGVLVLVNQTDWEILGGLDANLDDGDTVTFISTLHGG